MEHRIAMVAGATGDIGRAVVARFATEYERIVVVARDQDRLDELSRTYGESQVVPISGDLTDEPFVESVVDRVHERFGALDSLVCCQGLLPELSRIAEGRQEVIEAVFAINLFSPMTLARHSLGLLRRRTGSVTFLGSIAGEHANAMTACYGAAKCALAHFARTLAQEEGPHVRSNCVSPGWVTSAAMHRVMDQFNLDAEALLSRVPLKRSAAAEEVAELIRWIASPAAAFVSGSTYTINGGGQA